MKDAVRLVEVFSSIQGEGPYLGERQVFVRLGGCNLLCDYCDEPDTIPLKSGTLTSSAEVKASVLKAAKGKAHPTVSWTGGEPLLQAAALKGLMGWSRGHGFKNYLETNGVLPKAFLEVRALTDVAAVDLKLPSAAGKAHWKAHAEFLRLVPAGSFVKVVVTEATTDAEVAEAVRVTAENAPRLPFILQPATAVPSARGDGRMVVPPAPARLRDFVEAAKERLPDVRIVPQWHTVWGLP
ncbi:7-carboxy-7-deazaguanine synthase QueE [bacterium]|nr:MAG: 7-carboxy-7-deazaguanine synthase QueE [bacterium]